MNGRALIAWRVNNGYSEHELATALKVSISDIIHWERGGDARIPNHILMKLNTLLMEKSAGTESPENQS
jgi:transcriptional regulator with XRE-family HTH domain